MERLTTVRGGQALSSFSINYESVWSRLRKTKGYEGWCIPGAENKPRYTERKCSQHPRNLAASCRGLRATPTWAALLLVLCRLLSLSVAGPVGPLPDTTVTTTEGGIKEGSCAVGDVAYMEGDVFQGNSSCERCTCGGGKIHCAKQRCEPRPGCKALHRPDHCCPTYQCDCEHNGHVLANGEKLLDPDNPCRVCYCQGGEVVCRKIACFVRDDCVPRHVPGRCCPEYDNCPLTGVTTMPEVAPSISVSSPANYSSSTSLPPSTIKDIVKQEITIKEITPVSEIPVLTDVKIMEVLPSQLAVEYYSTKSPLKPREATTDKASNNFTENQKDTQTTVFSSDRSSSTLIPILTTKLNENNGELQINEDSYPIKISLSTQVPSSLAILLSSISTAGSLTSTPLLTTKAPVIEEEDTSVFEHNPAFPPLPDDLSVLRNHDDEIVPEPSVDADHVSTVQEVITFVSDATPYKISSPKEATTSMTLTEQYSSEPSERSNLNSDSTSTTQSQLSKQSPMLNLRSAIPTEILNIPSSVPEDVTDESDATAFTTSDDVATPLILLPSVETFARENFIQTSSNVKVVTEGTPAPSTSINFEPNTILSEKADTTTERKRTSTEKSNLEKYNYFKPTETDENTSNLLQTSYSPINLVNEQTETSFQTEISSLAIETSDQNPQENIDNNIKNKPTLEEDQTTENIITTSDNSWPENPVTAESIKNYNSKKVSLNRYVSTQKEEHEIDTTTEIFEKKTFLENNLGQTSETINLVDVSPTMTITTSTFTAGNSIVENFSKKLTISDNTNQNQGNIVVSKNNLKSSLNLPIFLNTVANKDINLSNTNSVTSESSVEFGKEVETSTDTETVELIKTSSGSNKNAPVIEQNTKQKSVLTDLINLVEDVASIGNHTENPPVKPIVSIGGISDSEELIPVNAGYKSKNNNWNLNSITEIPIKIKATQNKQKLVEIEDDGSATISDLPPPHDKTEPTTRLPIIDNVSDTKRENKTDDKDIEILTQSYVPTINKRPNKVIMNNNSETILSTDQAISIEISTPSTKDLDDDDETFLSEHLRLIYVSPINHNIRN